MVEFCNHWGLNDDGRQRILKLPPDLQQVCMQEFSPKGVRRNWQPSFRVVCCSRHRTNIPRGSCGPSIAQHGSGLQMRFKCNSFSTLKSNLWTAVANWQLFPERWPSVYEMRSFQGKIWPASSSCSVPAWRSVSEKERLSVEKVSCVSLKYLESMTGQIFEGHPLNNSNKIKSMKFCATPFCLIWQKFSTILSNNSSFSENSLTPGNYLEYPFPQFR